MFLKNFAKIKPSIIAKENKIDYSNVIQNKGKESNLKRIEKEVKKRLAIINLIENLDETEIESIRNLNLEIIDKYKEGDFINSFDIQYIYNVYKIFKEFIN